jgi:F-type H+-transporting ATPase subunit epsilon
MIPKSLALDISTPDKPIVHDEVDEVQLPGYNGALGVLPGHAPLLALLNPGELSYRKAQVRETIVIDFGVAEVLPDRVTVLVRLAEKPEDIDIAAQEAAKREAEAEMGKATSLEEADRARLALLTALMKMRAAERAQTRRS